MVNDGGRCRVVDAFGGVERVVMLIRGDKYLLQGMDGDDIFVGGPGPHLMVGGPGNDIYNVDDGGDLDTGADNPQCRLVRAVVVG